MRAETASASEAAAIAPRSARPVPTPTPTTITRASCGLACWRSTDCWRRRARSTSTLTLARSTTSKYCATRSSAATASSTKSSGPTTTAAAPNDAGPPSTTPSWSTSAQLAATPSTATTSIASPIWRPGSSDRRRRPKGKLPTDVWWHTIVATSGNEKTGYPTQKPQALAERIISASSNPRELVLDPFAGSGTVGAAAAKLDRRFLLIDETADAIACMRARLPDDTVFRDAP